MSLNTSVQTETIDNLKQRRNQILAFIDEHFGTQRAFCEATGLKPARVSKALQNRYLTNRRILPIEHAIEQWKDEKGLGASTEGIRMSVYRLQSRRLRPTGLQETVTPRLLTEECDNDKLAYILVTPYHHAVIELVDAQGILPQELDMPSSGSTARYAALVDGQWDYVTVIWDMSGTPTLAERTDAEVKLFGRPISTIKLL
ncbi:hypothetical protein CRI94_09815 [Longibacter salinarum]|uniref:Uncharacterized protein n=1 Tax=Longibacter salinarum TaxID=1850348 RepID=A0A2A8CYB7_9BACT|nr:hypothetical protein [Longibacter salinarum]PEN13594.1 hypothetical protein CRI94_09815 [Longibacter salinarum]